MGRWLGLLAVFLLPVTGRAHVVLPDNHDRFIIVHLKTAAKSRQVVIRVDYRLEVNVNLAIYTDLRAIDDQLDLSEFSNKRSLFFKEFTRLYAPIIGRNLDAALDGKPVQFRCVKSSHHLKDEAGRDLGHLRCDFVFEGRAPVSPVEKHRFFFREGNYSEANGLVFLSFDARHPIHVEILRAPTAALQAKHPTELTGREENRLRRVDAVFSIPAAKRPAPADEGKSVKDEAAIDDAPPDEDGHGDHLSLRDLFLRSDQGLFVLLLLAFGIGAVHALTPGHGKTLVAAYLVGERGTVWHAVLLGLVTTITHTGVVFVLAIALNWMSQDIQRTVLGALPLVGGLLVVSVGFWLLLRRISGRADHFHLGGHGHHHHGPGHHHHGHDQADHFHDAHGRTQPRGPSEDRVRWGSLVLLGISGGLVPCVDAVIMLILAAAMNLLWLAVPMLAAFSAGLAGVLVLVGILVVKAKGLVQGRWGESRLFRALPIISAVVVMTLGGWLCYDSVHGRNQAQDSRPQATHGDN